MFATLLTRVAWAFGTLIVASIAIFAILEVLPGDPAQLMLGINATDDAVAALRERMGFDRPLPVRYWEWITGWFAGDFGVSYAYSVPVSDLVGERILLSLPLALLALALSTAIALPVGIWAASRRGSLADTLVMGVSQIGIAVPNFWLALLLVFFFALTLQWLPAGGFPGWSGGVWPALKALFLPAVALALPQAAILSRVARSAFLDTMGEDYVRTARAKGLSWRATMRRHVFRNALIPVLTIIGLQFAYLLAGTIIIENVFYLPGLGRLVFQAITQRDLILVESVVLMLVAIIIAINFVIDLAYLWADPRLRRRTA